MSEIRIEDETLKRLMRRLPGRLMRSLSMHDLRQICDVIAVEREEARAETLREVRDLVSGAETVNEAFEALSRLLTETETTPPGEGGGEGANDGE